MQPRHATPRHATHDGKGYFGNVILQGVVNAFGRNMVVVYFIGIYQVTGIENPYYT
jgi:hypothetical protein